MAALGPATASTRASATARAAPDRPAWPDDAGWPGRPAAPHLPFTLVGQSRVLFAHCSWRDHGTSWLRCGRSSSCTVGFGRSGRSAPSLSRYPLLDSRGTAVRAVFQPTL